MTRLFLFIVIFIIFDVNLFAASEHCIKPKGIGTFLDLQKIDIFDDLCIKPVNQNDPLKLIHKGDAFGLKKVATCSTGIVAGCMALSLLYPPLLPFIPWSCITKTIIGLASAGIGIKIIENNLNNRIEALKLHNQNNNGAYPNIKIPIIENYILYTKAPTIKYILRPIKVGIGIGAIGMVGAKLFEKIGPYYLGGAVIAGVLVIGTTFGGSTYALIRSIMKRFERQ